MDSTAPGLEVTHDNGDDDRTVVQLTSCVRDATYYKEEGDCVMLVNTTLFKIHRFVLARDGSTFEGMFTLPTNDGPAQGSSDDNPIVLHDDIEDFRALCWALYALPLDISAPQMSTESDVSKFLGISRLANKYHFASFEKWATSTLSQKCMADATAFLLACSHHILFQILDLAALCRLSRLTTAVATVCIRRTKTGDLKFDQALRLGEKHGLDEFQGKIYYNHLQTMDACVLTPSPNGTAYIYDNSMLSPAQMRRLYTGYWSLSRYWQNICRMAPPQLPMVNGCNDTLHSAYCVVEWQLIWKAAISSVLEKRPSSANVIGNLDSLKLALAHQHPRAANTSVSCLASSGEVVSILRRDLEKTLAEHFLGTKHP